MDTYPLSSLINAKRWARLPSFAGFTVAGPDARAFLQGQLTNDIESVNTGQHQRTGFCSPKGRLLTTMLQWRLGEASWAHLVPAESLERITKRLKMFVLRSKVSFSSAEASYRAIGLWGEAAGKLANTAPSEFEGKAYPIAAASSTASDENNTNTCWLLMDTTCPVLGQRGWLIGPEDAIHSSIEALSAAQELPESAWGFSEIESGKAWVWEKTQDIFVPQMVNFELIQGVSFTKGCYPGQEVVARSQYLGKLKRRTYRADMAADEVQRLAVPISDLPGQDVWSKANPAEPCGRVVAAAPCFNAQGLTQPQTALLIELTIEAWESGGLSIGSLDGPALQAGQLPYSLAAAA
jgi:folate-binding protein YgfZ